MKSIVIRLHWLNSTNSSKSNIKMLQNWRVHQIGCPSLYTSAQRTLRRLVFWSRHKLEFLYTIYHYTDSSSNPYTHMKYWSKPELKPPIPRHCNQRKSNIMLVAHFAWHYDCSLQNSLGFNQHTIISCRSTRVTYHQCLENTKLFPWQCRILVLKACLRCSAHNGRCMQTQLPHTTPESWSKGRSNWLQWPPLGKLMVRRIRAFS